MHTYIHTYIHAYIHTYIHTYIDSHIHTCIHSYIPTCIHRFSHSYMHTFIHSYIRTCIHTFIHSYIHTNIHLYIHAYMQTVFYDFNWTLKENHALLVVSSCLLLLLHVLFLHAQPQSYLQRIQVGCFYHMNSVRGVRENYVLSPPWNEQNLLKRLFTWAGTTGTLGWYQSKFVGYESWKITHCVMFSSWNLGMFLWGLGHRLGKRLGWTINK